MLERMSGDKLKKIHGDGKDMSLVNKEDTWECDGKDIVVSEQGGYSGW